MNTNDIRETWAELLTARGAGQVNDGALATFIASVQLEHMLAISAHFEEVNAALGRIADALERPSGRPDGLLR